MNLRQVLFFSATAALFGGGGYYLGMQESPPTGEPASKVKIPVLAGAARLDGLPPGIVAILGTEPVTAANAGHIAFRALEHSDPVDRMGAISVLLQSMTRATAPAILQAFLDSTVKTGRRNDGEWGLMLRRYGAVMGADCFKLLLPERQNLALAVEGWASVDPDGVTKAMKEAHLTDSTIDTAWLTGISRSDPEKAMRLALSGQYAVFDAEMVIKQVIQTTGLEGARDALNEALEASPESAGSGPEFQALFGALADSMLHRASTEGDPSQMLSWIEKQKGQPFVTDNIIDKTARDALTKGKPQEVVAWLERMNDGRDGAPAGGEGLFQAAFDNPGILASLDDATFDRILPFIPKTGPACQSLATLLSPLNKARAERLLSVAPADGLEPRP